MDIRTRLTLTSAVLLVGAVTSSCGGGGGGAPTDASEDGFCKAANSLLEGLVPEDVADPQMPTDEEIAKAVKDWGKRMEDVGTPEGISDDAREGFEAVVDQTKDIDASDFSLENLEQLERGGEDASEETRKQAEAFGSYLDATCGSMMDDLEVPELPESTG